MGRVYSSGDHGSVASALGAGVGTRTVQVGATRKERDV